MVSFEVYPTSYQSVWANIFHMSIGKDLKQYGDRTPGVWFNPKSNNATENKLYICSAVNGDRDYCYNSKDFPLNNWIKVKVEQTEVDGNAMYRVYLDNEKVHEVVNTQPAEFDNVKVYVSDKWYNAQEGKIRNLIIDNRGAAGEFIVSFYCICILSEGNST